MNLTALDWALVAAVLAVMLIGVEASRRRMRGVADFLAANRTAGRYVLSLSQGLAALGAITIVGNFEMNYIAGFAMSWWGFTMSVVVLLIAVSGWVIYRFRQTRCLTLAEFFERRYSRRFRVFAGLIAFVSGLINFGIFPAVGARFFLHFCGLPEAIAVAGLTVPTYPLAMLVLLSISLWFVYAGGQVAVIITDFLQGAFVNVVFVVLVTWLFLNVGWDQVTEALMTAPEEASLINPFETGHVEDFNLFYVLIGVFGVIYGAMSWQGTQAYNSSAKSAHEAKMGSALGMWRGFPQNLLLLFVPIAAYTVMHHPDFASMAGRVNGALDLVDNGAVRNQLRIPLVLVELLPVGLTGAFTAVMLAAFISTHDTYLHSWGSIFVQDVVLPIRGRPLSPRGHLRALRASIAGVAVFIFFFSLLFRQSQHIFLFFAITGAIFAGGSGAVIIGGLYWKRGTTAGAWSALITGATIAVGGIIIHQLVDDFPVNGQMFWMLAMLGSGIAYVVASLLSPRPEVDLDQLLHRGKWAVVGEAPVGSSAGSRAARESGSSEKPGTTPGAGSGQSGGRVARGWRMLFMDEQFSRGDRILYVATYAWTLAWFAIFVGGTIWNLTHDVPGETWARFWKVYFFIQLGVSAFVVVWFGIGGFKDVRTMLRLLGDPDRDEADDGVVRKEDRA